MARTNRRFGYHSGTMSCKDANVRGDLTIQDDIIFSDVSAGNLGVTGGIDMDSTTSAKGIAMGGTYSTAAIYISGTCATDAIKLTGSGCSVDGIDVGLSPAAATAFNGINTVITTTMNMSGNVAGSRSYVTSNDTGKTHANMFGLVARATLLNASDTCTGTMTGLLCQIDLGAVSNSNSANAWGLCVNHIETGTRAKIPVAFVRFTDADYDGAAPTNYLFDCGGTGNEFPTGTGKIFYEHTLWARVNSTDKYIVLSDAENCLSLSGTLAATPISISGAFTTGISLSGDGTTGFTITSGFSGTNMLSLAGTGSNAAILISGACGKGIEITGSCTTGIGILTGTYTTGLSIAGTTTTGIALGACSTAGITMPGGASFNPIHIGVKGNTADLGLILTGATDDTGGIMVFCDDGGDALGSITSPIWTRYLLTTSQSAGATATGLYAQIKNLAATFNTGSYTALKAFNQVGGATTLNGAAELAIINAGISYEGNMTVTSGTLSGVDINVNDGGYTIGTSSGLIVRKTSGSTLGWTYGVNIASAGAVTGIYIGTCTTGISLAGAATTGIGISYVGATASAKALSTVGFTLNNGNLTDGYGAIEGDLTLTGTVVGAVSALSSWVNMATVTTGGNYICAQTNGLWSGSGCVATNGVFIFGMRAQCLMQTNGGVSGAKFYPFSVVNNTNVTTAIFKCNAGSSDLGTTAVSKTTEGKYVPLYEDDAGVHYVLIYN